MDIQLNFVNRSHAQDASRIVIFTRNALGGIDEMPVAWRVIDSGPGEAVRFAYPQASMVEANDEAGQRTPLYDAQPGQLFAMQRAATGGYELVRVGAASNPGEIQVLNGLDAGLIGASIYKDGRLLATRQSVSPKQKAVFAFKPVLWIGAVPQAQAQEGGVIHPALQPRIDTQLSLQGIASADIVMTGGGTGPAAAPLRFALENVQPA
jgi:hypothetical protein